METDLILQQKVLTKAEMPISAQQIADSLLEKYSGKESFVMVKSMIETLKLALELLEEKAIKSVNGKKEVVMGAEINLKSTPKKYKYEGQRYEDLKFGLEDSKGKLKQHTDMLEACGTEGWVNQATGETEKATLVSGEGTQITVTFQGTNKP